jgi:hypothetical protein
MWLCPLRIGAGASRAFAANYNLIPAIGVLCKSRPLYPHDAKPLASWRLHHDPAFQPTHDLGAERFEARDFRGNVIALNVNVDAAFMVDALDLHDRFVRRRRQHSVPVAAARMIEIRWAPERLGPKTSRRVHIGDIAIDQNGAKPGVMHFLVLNGCYAFQLRWTAGFQPAFSVSICTGRSTLKKMPRGSRRSITASVSNTFFA